MRVLIATAKTPTNFEQICTQIRASASEGDLVIPPGILWTGGPGCTNLAFDIEGDQDDAEMFANALTIALMPSKWCTTKDALPEVDTCEVGLMPH